MTIRQICGKFANAAGAHCVMKVGATTGDKKHERDPGLHERV